MVSVIVPNYNHLEFLPKRLETIFEQTFQDFEVVLLDDCSIDGSWEYLRQYEHHPKVIHCIRNDSNSGSPFHQWKKGIELAKGEIIWIAESDDWSASSFLQECVSMMMSNQLSLVMSGSAYVDSKDRILEEVITVYKEGIFEGNQFCTDFMYSTNAILNASAVIFSRDTIQPGMLDRILDFKLSGDHLFWVQLMKDQIIGILDVRLNYFRWHTNSVRAVESGNLTQLLEGIQIKNWMEQNFNIRFQLKFQARRNAYLTYFKFLKGGRYRKDRLEFIKVWYFLNPLDKLKSLIRFFII